MKNLFLKSTIIAWVTLFTLSKITTDYPILVIALFTLILSMWVGFIVHLLFGNSDSNNGGSITDSGWEGAC